MITPTARSIVIICGVRMRVDVVGHDDEGVEFVVPFAAIVLEGFEEEFGVDGELEEAATVVADGGDEEGASRGGSLRDGHGGGVGVGVIENWCK